MKEAEMDILSIQPPHKQLSHPPDANGFQVEGIIGTDQEMGTE
jgi:hypothetical protein